jgi:peptidoglycan/LPS O-acetylase OafA/YrhL
MGSLPPLNHHHELALVQRPDTLTFCAERFRDNRLIPPYFVSIFVSSILAVQDGVDL